jgi:hypothetical protein
MVWLDAGKSTRKRKRKCILLDERIVAAKEKLLEDIERVGNSPVLCTIQLSCLKYVSYLFGHPSFYEPELIDANLAEPASEADEEQFDTIDSVISSIVAAASATTVATTSPRSSSSLPASSGSTSANSASAAPSASVVPSAIRLTQNYLKISQLN